MTDGDITDMQETKDMIVKGSTAPLSVIIIGVGDEDFEMMGELDADKGGVCDRESEGERERERERERGRGRD